MNKWKNVTLVKRPTKLLSVLFVGLYDPHKLIVMSVGYSLSTLVPKPSYTLLMGSMYVGGSAVGMN